MRIQLSDHFSYKRLLHFVISPVFMMVFTSFYSIVDGLFVSNFVGKTPFAAVNLIMPVAMGAGVIGFMVGTGGSAVVAIALGEGKKEQANRYFSMLIYAAALMSAVLSVLGIVFMPEISRALGAEGELLQNCIIYGRILFAALPGFVLQCAFQNFFVTAEKPGLSLKLSVFSGITNAVLDFVFIVVFKWGIAGAALATAIGEILGGVLPVLYFSRRNSSLLRLQRTRFEKKVLMRAFANGSSEMVSNLSSSLVNILYNFQLMRLAGENGIAAYGVIMYVNFAFMAIFIGYSIGSAPIISYHYGAGNRTELKNLFQKSLVLIGTGGVAMLALAELFASPLVEVFAGYDAELSAMTCHGFRLYALSFVIMGFNIWGSAFFTALGDGGVSAAISFLRAFLFQTVVVIVLPLLLGLDGIWLAIVAAEFLAVIVTVTFLMLKKEQYQYT
ncbi:MAG: MATE family efflux transporter [Lachnospiraceae bacterium]|nr:MATE family efflux transporter [Lachnospiraceae bacterium]